MYTNLAGKGLHCTVNAEVPVLVWVNGIRERRTVNSISCSQPIRMHVSSLIMRDIPYSPDARIGWSYFPSYSGYAPMSSFTRIITRADCSNDGGGWHMYSKLAIRLPISGGSSIEVRSPNVDLNCP